MPTVFNPRSPCGERLCTGVPAVYWAAFQSTLPVGGATLSGPGQKPREIISIHAPRVGSDEHLEPRKKYISISIHAPRVGSDRNDLLQFLLYSDFNPRSPCGERQGLSALPCPWAAFQSTLPVWGATLRMSGACLFRCYFNPRSPCGERLLSDIRRFGPTYFNPRSPCGERLCDGFEAASDFAISIHAPRVGSDSPRARS